MRKQILMLLIGTLLGFLAGSWANVTHLMFAQQKPSTETIHPVLTAGSAAFGTLLVHRMAADQVMVKGVDLISFDQNLVNLLLQKHVASIPELEEVIKESKAAKILQLAPPTPAAPGKKPTGGEK